MFNLVLIVIAWLALRAILNRKPKPSIARQEFVKGLNRAHAEDQRMRRFAQHLMAAAKKNQPKPKTQPKNTLGNRDTVDARYEEVK